jgi:hypothetical protein
MCRIALRGIEASYASEAASSNTEWKELRDAGNSRFDNGLFEQAAQKFSDSLMFISLTDRPARVHLLNNRALALLKASKFNQVKISQKSTSC